MDIEKDDWELLKKAVLTNSAVLFLGAGFSADAKNLAGNPMPIGSQFAQILWEFLGYSGDYDNTPLADVFQAALAKKKHSDLQRLLDQSFKCSAVPGWYSCVSRFYWMRIYTVNVDDVIETVYGSSAGNQRLKIYNAIDQDYEERDPFLESLQYVKLNGTLSDTPKSVTFATRQYAKRLVDQDAWYDQFVRDYSTRVTVFIGTKLNEPLLYRAIEARGARYAAGEHRLRSFVICPSFSPVEVDNLRSFNVVPLNAYAKDFFEFLVASCSPLPSLEEVLLKTNPDLAGMLKIMAGRLSSLSRRSIENFYCHFHPVALPGKVPSVRKLYLQGAEPQWGDIYNELDAPRELNDQLITRARELHTSRAPTVLAITGSAGSGKGTALKRMALTLSSLGYLVFFSDSEELPDPHLFEAAIDVLPGRSFICLDNAILAIGLIPRYLDALKRTANKATIILAGRTHPLVDRIAEWNVDNHVEEHRMPDLSVKDADSIIDKLNQHHLLGKLAGLDKKGQLEIFLSYARRQILVAMREATLGHGFDEIIKDEFLHISPTEAQMIYLCAAIAMSAQFSITRQQLISCSHASPGETLGYIHKELRDLLIPVTHAFDCFVARHRVIAELAVDEVAPRQMLKEAYIRLLKTLSHDMRYPVDNKSRTFRLYRSVINHSSLYRRFSSDLECARAIYSALASNLQRDYHFWLQFGSLELEYGELNEAANYLEQSYALAPQDDFVLTTRAHLRYKQSRSATRYEVAVDLRGEAREILVIQMAKRQSDHYPVHVYCAQELAWINHWLPFAAERKQALEELREFAKQAERQHVHSSEVREIVRLINSAYIDLAIPGS